MQLHISASKKYSLHILHERERERGGAEEEEAKILMNNDTSKINYITF